ncbi:MAG TPA: DUF2868 domain-containing protein [Burkholderiaceae bacterium]|nr:DUF2868 domain-containing protein [Burkholderiaceae bacterium]
MNEAAARDAVLIRAIETADQDRVLITDEDRRHANRAAAELARWDAGARRSAASEEDFVAQRAELLARRLEQRNRPIERASHAFAWRGWISYAVPLLALAAGALLEHVADRQRVNLLAFPLFAIVVWNFAVYLILIVRQVIDVGRAPRLSGLRKAVARSMQRATALTRGPLAAPLGRFAADWIELSAPLMLARAARVLHLAAALFALGAIAGLYVRGLVFEYRVGWESTFLTAPDVHRILAFFLGPAASLAGVAFPSVEEVAALRFGSGSVGENAARWIHLYAITVGLAVIVPRLVLAAFARWREQRLQRRFPLDIGDPYFRRLLAGFGARPARLRVIPYSMTIDETMTSALRTIARRLLGDDADVVVLATVAYGDEDNALNNVNAADADVLFTAALFNLAATPENENHGAFVHALRAALGARFAALVDESSYRLRLGAQAGGDRLAERCNAWRSFGAAHGVVVSCVDLAAPDLAQIERDLHDALVSG